MQMLVTGEPIGAETALSWGLVNKVVADRDEDKALRGEAAPESRLYQETVELATTIAGHPTATIGHGKGVFYQQLEAPSLEAAYQVAGKAMVDGMQKPDAQEGVAAFIGKRKPAWPSNL